jgi:hypothetical protein
MRSSCEEVFGSGTNQLLLLERAGYACMSACLGAVEEGEGRGEWEPAVWTDVWEEDALGVVGDIVAVAVFVVGEVFGAECGGELDHGNVRAVGDGGDEWYVDVDSSAVRCGGGEQ